MVACSTDLTDSENSRLGGKIKEIIMADYRASEESQKYCIRTHLNLNNAEMILKDQSANTVSKDFW